MPSHSLTRRHFWTASRSRSCSCPRRWRRLATRRSAAGGLTSLTVPDGVRKLPSWVFSSCQSLASPRCPPIDLMIGMGAFHGCRSLTEITIPDSVQSIGEMAFANMARLQTIHVGAGNSAYQTVDGVLLTKAGDVLLAYPAARPGIRYDVPDGVTRIGERAFYGSGLMIVRFPQSLRTIADEAFKNSTRLIALDDFPAGTEGDRHARFQRQQYQRRVLRRHRGCVVPARQGRGIQVPARCAGPLSDVYGRPACGRPVHGRGRGQLVVPPASTSACWPGSCPAGRRHVPAAG